MFQKSENVPKICLIKCLKGHKSQGSLCSVLKTLIVSGNGPSKQASKGQGHLLSCCGQLKSEGLKTKPGIIISAAAVGLLGANAALLNNGTSCIKIASQNCINIVTLTADTDDWS